MMDLTTWLDFERTGRITPDLVQGLIEHNEAEERKRNSRKVISDFLDTAAHCEREMERVPWGF